jgi:hypothetical protein
MSKQVTEDAKGLVKKAIAFYKATGKRIALSEYSNPEGMFVQDEMYIYVLNPRGTILAHGFNEKLWGRTSLTSRIMTASTLSKRSSTRRTLKEAAGLNTNGTTG